MKVSLPKDISLMNKERIHQRFTQWRNYLLQKDPLYMILSSNHIFIEGFNDVPKRFSGGCKIYSSEGSLKYEGGYMYPYYHGYGKLITNDNEFYEGEFVKGEYDGKGIYYWNKEKIKFNGSWKNSIRVGKGREYQNNNLLYNGMWKHNLRNGIGKEYYKDNLIFDGVWKDDKRNGYGKEYDTSQNIIREGIWNDDELHKEVSDDELCIICFLEPRRIAFLPCGHFCICISCSQKYKDTTCVVCRNKFSITQKIFM